MRRVRDIYICNFRRNDGCVCCLAVSSACFKIEVLLKFFEAQQNLQGDYSSSMSDAWQQFKWKRRPILHVVHVIKHWAPNPVFPLYVWDNLVLRLKSAMIF